ncbi:unnamed protein product [Effrenium voratum]|uniref:Uncharacterized protein n=1 Tax=Effrenium voratum TaxID=2562239 RepID=A0AA36I4Z8_9DINO|nr:unnamed protein product [Effrenium voratum]CAJ1430898.1 unnamed protein product [Effrenium voratum]
MHFRPLLAASHVAIVVAGPKPSAFGACEGAWDVFRGKLEASAAGGFPEDAELAQLAEELLQEHWPALQPDEGAIYGMAPAMQSFFGACNAPPEAEVEAFCLYGAVSALWVSARHVPTDREQRDALLRHGAFLLGEAMRSTLDFMEGSGWPIDSLDILANLGRPNFRLPPELRTSYRLEPPAKATAPSLSSQLRVWEIGVHASLSAEPLQMWSRVLAKDLQHRNLIRDQYPKWLPDKCATLYQHPNLHCDNVQDDLTQLFRERIPHSAVSNEPVEDMTSFAADFVNLAASRLREVDVFLCTIAYLCLLVEALDVPTLGYFGHPLLFMVPDDHVVRESFWAKFMGMARSRTVAFAVSDPFLQMQYEYQVGSPRLPAIRSHALYTRASYVPSRNEVLVLDRPHESVLMCLLQRSLGSRQGSWPTLEGRLRAAGSEEYPFGFTTRSLTDKQFSTFAQFKAVVLWAYDMDLITFYEFYSMSLGA